MELTALMVREKEDCQFAILLGCLAPLFQQSSELPTAVTVQQQRPVGNLVV